MLSDYRAWLDSELKLLGNASHHAYSFGQVNIAKSAIEQLNAELDRTLCVALHPAVAWEPTALEMQDQATTDPGSGAGNTQRRLEGGHGRSPAAGVVRLVRTLPSGPREKTGVQTTGALAERKHGSNQQVLAGAANAEKAEQLRQRASLEGDL